VLIIATLAASDGVEIIDLDSASVGKASENIIHKSEKE